MSTDPTLTVLSDAELDAVYGGDAIFGSFNPGQRNSQNNSFNNSGNNSGNTSNSGNTTNSLNNSFNRGQGHHYGRVT